MLFATHSNRNHNHNHNHNHHRTQVNPIEKGELQINVTLSHRWVRGQVRAATTQRTPMCVAGYFTSSGGTQA
jgi:hypothetical protein